MKACLNSVETEKLKLSCLAAAVNKSNMLKLSKCGTLLKRRIPFVPAQIDSSKMDQCTVYVENFPESITLEDIAKIFARVGEIHHVSLPKFKQDQVERESDEEVEAMETDCSQSLTKGFCFIEFDSKESAERAVHTFNNCVPEEFQNNHHKNYIEVKG